MDLKLLKQILAEISEIKSTMVTKDYLKQTLGDNPTKDDLKVALANYPTKNDLKKSMANYPTKDDLHNALEEQAEDFGDLVNELVTSLDEKKADRIVVHKLEKRIIMVESKFAA